MTKAKRIDFTLQNGDKEYDGVAEWDSKGALVNCQVLDEEDDGYLGNKVYCFFLRHLKKGGKVTKDIDLPSSDVVQFVLEDGSVVTVRPSGTEPKIKFYASCRAPAGLEPQVARQQVLETVAKLQRVLDGWIS